MRLAKPIYNGDYHLFTDNFYTAVETYNELAKCGIKATGTIRKSRKQLPTNFGKSNLPKG